MGRWHAEAVGFLRRHRRALVERPLAIFALGPRTTGERDLAGARAQLDRALAKVPDLRPCTIAIFGGVIDPATLRFPFRRMPASDARDWHARGGCGGTGNPQRVGRMPAVSFSGAPDGGRAMVGDAARQRSELDRREPRPRRKELEMRKLFEIGGVVAAAILVGFGIAAIVMGLNGRGTVHDSLKQESIVGSPDMTPAAIAAEAKKAGLPASIGLPTVAVAGKAITSGERARAFASYMRIHTLEATGGLTYAQMGRWTAKPGAPAKFTDGHGATSDPKYALTDPKTKQPVDNGLRNLWVTETALTTALNTSYMAERLSIFGIVVGVALLLAGFGFAILAIGGALRNSETVLAFARGWSKKSGPTPLAPTA
jgi:hypothetical protein